MEEGEIKAEEILQICSKIFDEDKLCNILFKEITGLPNKEEYLEMILLFIPEKETQQILKVINKYLIKENENKIKDLFDKIFRRTSPSCKSYCY